MGHWPWHTSLKVQWGPSRNDARTPSGDLFEHVCVSAINSSHAPRP
jgi:hypothetical protein